MQNKSFLSETFGNPVYVTCFVQQGIIALTYAKVILTKLDGVQNSFSLVLYILEN
jgi:hypothetical protein